MCVTEHAFVCKHIDSVLSGPHGADAAIGLMPGMGRNLVQILVRSVCVFTCV